MWWWCVWWCVCGGVNVVVCMWWCVCGGVYVVVCMWWCVCGGVCVCGVCVRVPVCKYVWCVCVVYVMCV